MDWLLRVWIKIKIWWLQLLGKTVIDEKIINTVKEIENRVHDIHLKIKKEQTTKKKKRGRKPKKK
jgi:hypothetical protein